MSVLHFTQSRQPCRRKLKDMGWCQCSPTCAVTPPCGRWGTLRGRYSAKGRQRGLIQSDRYRAHMSSTMIDDVPSARNFWLLHSLCQEGVDECGYFKIGRWAVKVWETPLKMMPKFMPWPSQYRAFSPFQYCLSVPNFHPKFSF